MLFSSYIVIRTTSSWMKSCLITRFDTKNAIISELPSFEFCSSPEPWGLFVFLILETVPRHDPRPKEAVHSHIHRQSLPFRRKGVQLVRACLIHCIHPEMIPCHTDVSMLPLSAAGQLWEICCISDVFPATRAEHPKRPKCSTSGEWDPYPATQAAKASFTAILHHFGSQATNRTRRRTPWMSELSSRRRLLKAFRALKESPLSLAKSTKTLALAPRQCQRRAISPQQPNIFLTSNDHDVDQSWKQGSPFTDSFPAPYAKRPEKRWLCTRRSSFCREKRVAVEALLLFLAPLRTKAVLTVLHRNDPPWPWPRLDYCRQPTRFPEELAYKVLRALQRSMMLAWACMLNRPYAW